MDPKAIVQAAIKALEEKNVNAFASHLSDDLICRQILPQTEGKAQLLSFVNSLTTAFPGLSFNGHILHEEREADQSWSVLFVTAVTGTQTGDLILPTLPIIPATGRKIALPYRHLGFHRIDLLDCPLQVPERTITCHTHSAPHWNDAILHRS